jgi:hypothetical protein
MISSFFIQTEDYLLPCLNKQLFGIDCLGCGIQRAFLLLLKGEFIAAFKMYPAIYTLLLLAIYALLHLRFKFKKGRKIIRILVVVNLLIIIVSYFIKMNFLF